jgi:hypothetical protein
LAHQLLRNFIPMLVEQGWSPKTTGARFQQEWAERTRDPNAVFWTPSMVEIIARKHVRMETIIGIMVGIALAAACGFRVFVPLLALGIAGAWDTCRWQETSTGSASTPALIALATATVAEIVAYYVPWLDHALDTIATPSAVLAGVIATAAVVGDLPPGAALGMAIIAGGGVAGTVQGATVLARLKSGTMTAGLANPVVATAELAGSVITSVLAVLVPLIAVALIVLLACVGLSHHAQRLLRSRHTQLAPENEILDDRQERR